jgi:dipeptidyl aminopeptidase/acylaminoacyl peptidase
VLAFVDSRERVRVLAVDSGRELWRTAPVPGVHELGWSPDGGRLLVATPRRLVVRGRGGRVLARRALPAGLVADDVAWSPRGDRVAVVRRGAERSDVVLADLAGTARSRLLYSGPGRFGRVAWSPSGRRLLVPWPEADQWLFLSTDGGRIAAVANIRRQFAAGPRRSAFPDAVEWCCAR